MYNRKITWRIILEFCKYTVIYHDKPNHKTIQEFRKITPKIWFVRYIVHGVYTPVSWVLLLFFYDKIVAINWKRWSTQSCIPHSVFVCGLLFQVHSEPKSKKVQFREDALASKAKINVFLKINFFGATAARRTLFEMGFFKSCNHSCTIFSIFSPLALGSWLPYTI